MSEEKAIKGVYQIIERENAESLWKQVGIGFVNRDDSINLILDSIPLTGKLHVRDMRNGKRKEYGHAS